MSRTTDVIMPVLGMSQDSGRLLRWLKGPGERVQKGELLMEVETDKAVMEIEAPTSGVLSHVRYAEGASIPVTEVMAVIVEDELAPAAAPAVASASESPAGPPTVSPLAARLAVEHGLDLAQIKPRGGRIEKADVLAYIEAAKVSELVDPPNRGEHAVRRALASPKARRLAEERGLRIAALCGSGPDGAVLVEDVLAAAPPAVPAGDAAAQLISSSATAPSAAKLTAVPPTPPPASDVEVPVSPAWARMVERLSAAWPQTPHFCLTCDVDAARLMAWRELAQQQVGAAVRVTYTDLLVKLAALALRRFPRVNVYLREGRLFQAREINIGLAVATAEDLAVPVIHVADTLGLAEIAARRAELAERARANKLRLEDLQEGRFTISNLGMYDIDAFSAMVNPGQAGILAVGRIADRVVAVNGQPVIRPMLTLTASFDHRAVDGARGAQFLQTLAAFIAEPLAALT